MPTDDDYLAELAERDRQNVAAEASYDAWLTECERQMADHDARRADGEGPIDWTDVPF